MENGIPNYLKPYVSIIKESKDFKREFIVMGNIKCTCSNEEFYITREKWIQSLESKEAEKHIQTLLEKHKDKNNGSQLCITSKQGKDYIANIDFKTGKEQLFEDITEIKRIAYQGQLVPTHLEAICSHCGKKILIFDERQHGYNGLITELKKEYAKDFTIIKKPKCRKCGSETYKIIITISNTGKDDLFAENNDLINENNWENAFDWIAIDLKCSDCGKDTKKYLDLETM